MQKLAMNRLSFGKDEQMEWTVKSRVIQENIFAAATEFDAHRMYPGDAMF